MFGTLIRRQSRSGLCPLEMTALSLSIGCKIKASEGTKLKQGYEFLKLLMYSDARCLGYFAAHSISR